MMLMDISDFLTARGITPVYLGQLPDVATTTTNSTAVALFDYPGLAPVYVQPQNQTDPIRPSYEKPRLQVKVRGNKNDYLSGYTLAQRVYNQIVTVVNQTLNATRYQALTPLQNPSFLDWDENRRPIFIFNVQVEKDAEAVVV